MNLGDGNGWVNQTILGYPALERAGRDSLEGTTSVSSIPIHLRARNMFGNSMYRQNGDTASSGALFLAVSKEEDATKHHTISPDGYDIGDVVVGSSGSQDVDPLPGRDLLVQRATGKTFFKGVKYTTTARRISGLILPGSEGGPVKLLPRVVRENGQNFL
ncbi:hypothetical protein GGX14DRAFT_578642 [Mycena pura]|uniref:Uncharacterized protein n=1 Tax=Mycena pura TaxID=153505 RepID=A0AAD6USA0_9AGAR|nr:hypothetical protein GGX14DRAFT_578642 [Mycena pura]